MAVMRFGASEPVRLHLGHLFFGFSFLSLLFLFTISLLRLTTILVYLILAALMLSYFLLLFLFPLISNAFGLLNLIRNSGNILGFSVGWTVLSLLFQFPCYITNLYIEVYSFCLIRESRLISDYFHCYSNVRP